MQRGQLHRTLSAREQAPAAVGAMKQVGAVVGKSAGQAAQQVAQRATRGPGAGRGVLTRSRLIGGPIAVLTGLVGLTSCVETAEPPAQEPGMALWFAPLATSGCVNTTNGQKQLPLDIQTVVAQWSAQVEGPTGSQQKTGKSKIERSKLTQGAWEIKGLPATSALDLQVFGCTKDKKVAYLGRNDGVKVVGGTTQSVRLFLAPSDKLACTGSPTGAAKLGSPRSLAGSVALSSGDAAVVGGMGSWDAGFGSGEAAATVDLYDARLGHFRQSGKLAVARIQPHVHEVIKDGVSSLLVVGGALKLQRSGDETKFAVKLLMPSSIADALPSAKAELIDLVGATPGNRQSKADVGEGANLFSSSIRLAKSILFVGGVGDNGQIRDKATRLNALEDVAAGGSGTANTFQLNAARIRPALLSFEDGSVVVWGGAVNPDKTAPKAEAMGELVQAESSVSEKLTLTGAASLLGDANLSTVGPVVVPLARTADVLTFLVSGGVTVQSKLSAKDALTYVVTVNRTAKTAHLQTVSWGGEAKVRAGYAGIGVALDGRRVLLGGGLVAASQLTAVCPDGGPSDDCALASAWVLRAPETLPAGEEPVVLEVLSEIPLGGPRFGVAAVPLGLGALLAGGQVSTRSVGAEVLDDVGEVLTLTPAALDPAVICN